MIHESISSSRYFAITVRVPPLAEAKDEERVYSFSSCRTIHVQGLAVADGDDNGQSDGPLGGSHHHHEEHEM